MQAVAKIITHTVAHDGKEIARSFFAGAAYMAAMGMISAGALFVVKGFAPDVAEVVAPNRFPVYSAHKLARVERLEADRWGEAPPMTPALVAERPAKPQPLLFAEAH